MRKVVQLTRPIPGVGSSPPSSRCRTSAKRLHFRVPYLGAGFELSLYFHMGFDVEISLFHHFIISSLRFRSFINFIIDVEIFIIASRLNFHISSWKFHHFIISSFCNLLISSWKFHHFIISSLNFIMEISSFHHPPPLNFIMVNVLRPKIMKSFESTVFSIWHHRTFK